MDHCTFCDIAAGRQPAHKVYEDDAVLAFLDILPLRPGHLLVVPKQHFERINHLPDTLSVALGLVMPRIARALCAATSQPDFTLLSNQGYRQVVPHVHYHFIPAPSLDAAGSSQTSALLLGREELDDGEGERMAARIRAELEKEARARL